MKVWYSIVSIPDLCTLTYFKGIPIFDKDSKSTLFADDATFALDGSFKSFNELINILETFKSISGLKRNNIQTTVLRIGSLRNNKIEYMK